MASGERIVYIDILRGWAGLVMIEVHVFNAFIEPSIKESAWFGILNFVNGLVAPAFLFVAGMVFVIVSERKLEAFRRGGSAFWKQISRIGLIWGIGYGLHLPFFSLRRTISETTNDGWLRFFQVDILQCIAVGLLFLFLVRLMLRQRRVFEVFLWISTSVFVFAAPFLWEFDFGRFVHPAIAAYLNGMHYSLFPVFPWLGFMLAGGLVGIRFMSNVDQEGEGSFIRTMLWAAGVLLAVYFLIDLPIVVPYASTAIRSNPLFLALRLGIILLLLTLCWWYDRRRRMANSFVLDVSRETLLVYSAHLLVIYGTFWGDRSLAGTYGGSFSTFQCVLATVALAAAMVLAARLWGSVKKASRPVARNIAFAGGIVVTLVFLVK